MMAKPCYIQHSSFCINFRSINHVRSYKSLLESRLNATQALFGLNAVAEIADTKTKVRLGVGQVNRDVRERLLELFLYFFSVFQRFVANFHEHVDAIAAERAVDSVK